MPAPRNLFKQAMQGGRAQVGLWQVLASACTAEICAGAGLDWLLIEAEHAPTTFRSAPRNCRRSRAAPIRRWSVRRSARPGSSSSCINCFEISPKQDPGKREANPKPPTYTDELSARLAIRR